MVIQINVFYIFWQKYTEGHANIEIASRLNSVHRAQWLTHDKAQRLTHDDGLMITYCDSWMTVGWSDINRYTNLHAWIQFAEINCKLKKLLQ